MGVFSGNYSAGQTGGPGAFASSVFNMFGTALTNEGILMQSRGRARGLRKQAEASEFQALDVAQGMEFESRMRNLAQREAEGEQRAIYGALGLSTTEGQPVENLAEMAKMMNLNKLMARRNSRLQIYGLREGAKELRRASKQERKAGTLAALSNFF